MTDEECLTAEAIRLIEEVWRLRKIIAEAREGFALIAEGEGPDVEVYKSMGDYYMGRIDAVIGKLKHDRHNPKTS